MSKDDSKEKILDKYRAAFEAKRNEIQTLSREQAWSLGYKQGLENALKTIKAQLA